MRTWSRSMVGRHWASWSRGLVVVWRRRRPASACRLLHHHLGRRRGRRRLGATTQLGRRRRCPGAADGRRASPAPTTSRSTALSAWPPAPPGGSARSRSSTGRRALRQRRRRLGVGRRARRRDQRPGSLGGTGTIRVARASSTSLSPNAGSAPTVGVPAANGHMVVEGDAVVVANAPRGRRAATSSTSRPAVSLAVRRAGVGRPRHRHDDQRRAARFELTGDGGCYRGSGGRPALSR